MFVSPYAHKSIVRKSNFVPHVGHFCFGSAYEEGKLIGRRPVIGVELEHENIEMNVLVFVFLPLLEIVFLFFKQTILMILLEAFSLNCCALNSGISLNSSRN